MTFPFQPSRFAAGSLQAIPLVQKESGLNEESRNLALLVVHSDLLLLSLGMFKTTTTKNPKKKRMFYCKLAHLGDQEKAILAGLLNLIFFHLIVQMIR